jgi:hypothetical protein
LLNALLQGVVKSQDVIARNAKDVAHTEPAEAIDQVIADGS